MQLRLFSLNFLLNFYLILCGCLAMLSSELKFLLKHKILIIFYFIVSIVIVIFASIIRKDFFILIISLSLLVLLSVICLSFMTIENFLRKKLEEAGQDSRRIFDNYLNMTKALNAGVFLFKNDDLLFYNEIGAKILLNAPTIALNKFRPESINLNDCTTEMKHFTPQVDVKVSMTDSTMILNDNRNSPYASRKLSENKNQEKEQMKFIFKNIFLYDDTSNFTNIMKKCKNTYTTSEENNLEERINLLSIFRFLLNSKSSSHAESNCHCLSNFNEDINLGVFEIEFAKGKKTNYEIIVKLEGNLSKEITLEFIFKDVTPHYDLIRKMDEKSLLLKKNVHEFKTPILSLLGCTAELKSFLLQIEDFLPEDEKNQIKTYLEHITNLGSFITYLVKGLTISNTESTTKTIVVKTIKLNPLLKFCFSILQSLLSCDSQKMKNVKTEVKNKIKDVEVSFKSDEVQVKQILLNFISNAVKFTNFGKIILSAKLKKGNKGQFLKIKIKDSGCGVKKEDKAKLFQEYAKLNETKNNTFGTGLGLNICKTMADDLKMKIKFKSEEKKGTKVSLYIFNPDLKFVRLNNNYSLDSSLDISKNSLNCFSSENGLLKRSLTTNIKSKFQSEGVVIKKSYTKLLENVISETIPRFNSLKPSKTKSFTIREVDENEEEEGEGLSKNITLRNDFVLSRQDTVPNPFNANFDYSELPYFKSNNSDRIEFEANYIKRQSTQLLEKYHSYDITRISELPRTDREQSNNNDYSLRIDEENTNSLIPGNNPINISHIKSPVNKNKLNNCFSDANAFKKVKRNTSKNAILSRIHKDDPSQEINSNKDKIIIVDDQLHSRRALLNMFNLHFPEKVTNYEFIEECDGIDCLKTVIKFPYTVKYILIDENMNFMNGSETAEIIGKLFQNGKISKINLILTSAEDNLSEGQKNLFDLCVTKPLSRENIEKIFDTI